MLLRGTPLGPGATPGPEAPDRLYIDLRHRPPHSCGFMLPTIIRFIKPVEHKATEYGIRRMTFAVPQALVLCSAANSTG